MDVGGLADGPAEALWEQTAWQRRRCEAVWFDTPDERPDLGPTIGVAEQREREAFLDDRIDALSRAIKELPALSAAPPEASVAWKERLLALIEVVLREGLGFGPDLLAVLMRGGFTDVGVEFGRSARCFDPALAGESIFQAWRNAWVMNVLQLAAGRPVSLTPAVFAYSMLYPYSDNLLDDPAVSLADKAAYNARLERRLASPAAAMGDDAREAATDALVRMIEGQFAREAFPRVYGALLAIHRAQCHSLALHRRGASPFLQDVVGLSLEKGGASVLADAYLVEGEVTEARAAFAFGLGVYLQLADDLQDVASDRNDGTLTVFSVTAGRWPLDALVNRLLRLPDPLLAVDAGHNDGRSALVRELVRRSSGSLIVGAVAQHARWFSRDYVRWLEAHAPTRLAAQQRLRRRLAEQVRALLRVAGRGVLPLLAQPPSPGPLADALAAHGASRGAGPR